MCVIIANKVKLKNSNIENWFLYKIRDRNYSPKYELEVKDTKKTETLFLTDQGTTWSEGVNSDGLMIVSAALDNGADFEDNGNSSDGKNKYDFSQQTNVIKDAMTKDSVKEAVKTIVDGKFVGTTFISDGVDLTIVEVYINTESFEREVEKFGKDKFEKMSSIDQLMSITLAVKPEDYDVEVQEIKKETLCVRTNHGKLIPTAGFQADDEEKEGWISSNKRYDYTETAIKKLGDSAHPFDVLTTLKNLKNIDKDNNNCPIRLEVPEVDGHKPYYSSTIVMLTPTGTMFAVPLDAEVSDKKTLTLKKERKTHFVLLPKALPLFENTSDFITGIYNKEYKELIFNEDVFNKSKMSLRERLIYESN